MISMRALFGEGIGFATPIDSITSVLPSLLRRKKPTRGYLGLKMSDSSPEDDERLRSGAYVQMVLPKSPAEAAGLAAEDLIVEVEGRKVKHFSDIQRLVRSAKVGTQLHFKVKRGGKSHAVTATVDDIRNLLKEVEMGPGRGAPRSRIMIIPRPA